MGKGRIHLSNKPSRTTFRDRLEEMVTALRDDIITGRLSSGQFLPSILQLSKRYQLSINSVQKGLDQLVAEDLVERLPRVGNRVREKSAHQTVSLAVGYYPSLANDIDLHALIARFEAQYPYIQVQLVPLQYGNYYEVSKHYLENGILDVISINYINFDSFKSQYADLRSIFEPLKPASGQYPYLSPPFMQNDLLFVQPVTFSPVVLCYNKAHFAERQVQEPARKMTWHAFMALMDQVSANEEGKLGFYFYPATSNRWPIFLLQSGVSFQTDGGRSLDWSNPAIMDSIQTCYDLIHRQNLFSVLLSENDVNVESLFADQRVSVMMTTYFNLNKLRDVGIPFELGPLPYVHVPKTLLLTIGFAVNSRSGQREAAKVFVDFMADDAAQQHIRQHTFSLPASRQAAEAAYTGSDYRPESFDLYNQIATSFSYMSDLHLKNEDTEKLVRIMNMYWLGIESRESTEAHLAALGKAIEVRSIR